MDREPVVLTGDGLTIAEIVDVARGFRRVELSDHAAGRIGLCREVVEDLLERQVKVYGLTTGFASLRDVAIEAKDAHVLSRNLIVSHAAGVGDPFPEDVVRAATLLRAQALVRGNSGVRVALVELLLAFLNAGIYPFVPAQGSCGSSGDLAPLSHLVLAFIGDAGARVHRSAGADRDDAPADDADYAALIRRGRGPGDYVAKPRIEDFLPLRDVAKKIRSELDRLDRDQRRVEWPYELAAKEGLAANNGAVFSTAMLALAAFDGGRLIASSEAAASLSFEAAQAVSDCLDPGVTGIRPHPGQITSAAAMRRHLHDSQLVPAFGALGLNMACFNQVLRELCAIERDAIGRALKSVRQELEKTPDDEAARHREAFYEWLRSAIHDELRQPTAAALRDVWRDIERARERERSRADRSYPKEQELAACNAATRALREHWTASMEALPQRLRRELPGVEDAERWLVRLREIHRLLGQSVRESPDVQNNYSFRAAPTVIGVAREALDHVIAIAETEANSSTDNPLILLDGILRGAKQDLGLPDADDVLDLPTREQLRSWLDGGGWRLAADSIKSAANFHGQPVGAAADQLAAAVAEMGNIAERRIAVLIDRHHSNGLPPYLTWNLGLNSGFMIPQYTAASLVAENRILASPASTDSIPTGEGFEDHVAMSTTACRQCLEVIENVERIVAIEALCAYQGVQFRKPARLGRGTRFVERRMARALENHFPPATERKKLLERWGVGAAAIEQVSPCVLDDQVLYIVMEQVADLVRRAQLVENDVPGS